MPTFLALLRGINVGGHRKVPMAGLRALATDLGFYDVQSYIQSGNLVFRAAGKAPAIEQRLEQAVEQRFLFHVDIVVRTSKQWQDCKAGNPFAAASEREPNGVMLALSKRPLLRDAGAQLQQRATAGERVQQLGDALWIHYAGGVAKSKLTPALLDRLAGSPVTARNWNTVQQLAAMAAAHP
jgi:uncharacterized protein (DUF1697 family)